MTMAAMLSRNSLVRLASLKTSPATLHAASGLSIRRLQSTFASTSYENILVDVVGTNKDISLITLNRPKAVCSSPLSPIHAPSGAVPTQTDP